VHPALPGEAGPGQAIAARRPPHASGPPLRIVRSQDPLA
jgi:hypothetical protein